MEAAFPNPSDPPFLSVRRRVNTEHRRPLTILSGRKQQTPSKRIISKKTLKFEHKHLRIHTKRDPPAGAQRVVPAEGTAFESEDHSETVQGSLFPLSHGVTRWFRGFLSPKQGTGFLPQHNVSWSKSRQGWTPARGP